jgi:hypothetical protein
MNVHEITSICVPRNPHHILKVQYDFARCLLRTKRAICKLVTGERESVQYVVQGDSLNKFQASVRTEMASLLVCDRPKFNT